MAQIVGRYLAQPTAGTHTHQTVERVGRRTAETPNTPKNPNPPTVFINLFNSQPDFCQGLVLVHVAAADGAAENAMAA